MCVITCYNVCFISVISYYFSYHNPYFTYIFPIISRGTIIFPIIFLIHLVLYHFFIYYFLLFLGEAA